MEVHPPRWRIANRSGRDGRAAGHAIFAALPHDRNALAQRLRDARFWFRRALPA